MQFGTLLLFFGTAHWGWTVAGRPLLQGNLSAASLAGTIPLADPFAALKMLATRHLLLPEFWIGAAIVFTAWLLLGGRAFCAWACPLNVVTDAAAWLRERLGLRDLLGIPTTTRYGVPSGSPPPKPPPGPPGPRNSSSQDPRSRPPRR